jgi:hypothetical protein
MLKDTVEQIPQDPFGAFLLNEKYIIGKLIGEGNYGKVYKVVQI